MVNLLWKWGNPSPKKAKGSPLVRDRMTNRIRRTLAHLIGKHHQQNQTCSEQRGFKLQKLQYPCTPLIETALPVNVTYARPSSSPTSFNCLDFSWFLVVPSGVLVGLGTETHATPTWHRLAPENRAASRPVLVPRRWRVPSNSSVSNRCLKAVTS